MKISAQSHTAIVSAIQKALENYATPGKKGVATDIYFQPDMVSGELTIYNDDDQLLGQLVVKEWVDANPENFMADAEMILKKILNQLMNAGEFSLVNIVKPYSLVLVDGSKESVAELLLVDEDETLIISDELLKGLDEELNAFLIDLLEK